MKLRKPIIVTMGEPSGISSEIIIKTWLKRKSLNVPQFILIDDLPKLKKINRILSLQANFQTIQRVEDASKVFNISLPVLDLKANISPKLGIPDKKNSKFVLQSINEAVKLILKNKVSGLLTLPVCKKTLKEAKFNFNGQTEYLSHLTKKITGKTCSEIMILSTTKPIDNGENLIVGLITTHIPFRQIHSTIKKKIICDKILSFKKSLTTIWKKKSPKIAITSINPHAGEGGLIGDEELKLLKPVIEKFRNSKIKVIGPLSADSCFHKSIRKSFDGILCFYHDQGLIPVKTLDFNNSINVTGGLPFLRVSPDHGPAFDIAKKKIARIDSLVASFNFLKKFA